MGTAGTGKSYLIKGLKQLLGNHCLLCGTTGMAAFQIAGKTLHSAASLPIVCNKYKPLKGAQLKRLQNNIDSTKIYYIIIDEVSMLGQKLLEILDSRLRQASGKLQ